MIHPITIGSVEQLLATKIKEKTRSFYLLADENTYRDCYPRLSNLISEENCIVVPSGESHKNIQTCTLIWQFLSDKHADRKTVLVCLGGGVIGDMGGFCAATYKRGINTIVIPTTLLAMVDASIGGKTGIDFQNFKNQIGAFHLSEQVIVDTSFLQTLSAKHIETGIAEMWKHILITDSQMANALFQNKIDLRSDKAIQTSIEIKMSIVSQDFQEQGLRKQLNLGHTLGHAIESSYLETNQPITHGEAVFAGLWLEQYCSWKKGLFPKNEWNMLSSALMAKLPSLDLPLYSDRIFHFLAQDKKNTEGQVQFVLLRALGACVWDMSIEKKWIMEALESYPKKTQNL